MPASGTLFLLPFLAGLAAATALPLVGIMLRVRDEWLAALSLTQWAAAGVLLANTLAQPAWCGALLGGGLAAAAKSVAGARGNTWHAAAWLTGWAIFALIAANAAGGGWALIDGQIYFAGTPELFLLLVLAVVTVISTPWLGTRLLRDRLFPALETANGRRRWPWRLLFEALAAGTLAMAAASLGLMATLALAVLPAWLAFAVAPSLRAASALALALSIGGFIAAFWVALRWDQPFGPVLVLALVTLVAVGGLVLPRLSPSRRTSRAARSPPWRRLWRRQSRRISQRPISGAIRPRSGLARACSC